MQYVLIDDNKLDNFIHRKMIQVMGGNGEVVIFEKVDEALDFFRKKSAATEPDMIFLDLKMPGRDGFDFLNEFGELPATIREACRIVVLSSSVSAEDVNRAMTSRLVERFYSKPLRMEQMEELLKK